MIRPVTPLLAALLGLTLSACTPQPPALQAEAAAAPTQDTATRCPDAGFEPFLERFSAQVSVQQSATLDPLTVRRVDSDAQPEPALVTEAVALAQIAWPVMPDLQAARRNGRSVDIQGDGDQRVVTVLTPDTSDQQRYHFRQQPCWTLVRLEDDAI